MNKSKTCADTFRFEDEPFFHQIRKTLPDNKSHTQNLIECKDDILFGWSASNSCVLTYNWRAAQSKKDGSIQYQTLLPSSPVDFAVERIIASHEGSFLALSGSRGVTILELPCRWGPYGQFKEGKERILCSSHSLDERFFSSNPSVNVLQVRWHPASAKDCNLLVLLSNNSIRVYDEGKLRYVWKIGVTPCALPPTNSNLPYLNSLGDTAVDFDIGPPRVIATDAVAVAGNVEWPLIILRGNGSLYVVLIGIDTEKPRIKGPLTMLPTTKDNFGVNACALLVLPSNPLTVIIAEPSGKLFHSILIDADPIHQESSFSEIDSSLRLEPAEWVVNVLEVVELELGLTTHKDKHSYDCQIYLKADVNNDYRYFAYHNTGLHAVCVEFVPELEKFFNSGDHNDELSLDKPSHVEYLVCTKALDSAKTNPVLGFTFLQSPAGIVILLSSGQIVTLNVITNPAGLRQIIHSKSVDKSSKSTSDTLVSMVKTNSASFETHIKEILQSGASQPILKLNSAKDITSKETLELLIHALQTLRDNCISKHDRVKQELEKRVKILKVMKQQQEEEIAQLLIDKNEIRNNAERLAEMYEEINDKQQELIKRMHDILRLVNLKLPQASIIEKNFCTQVEKINAVTKDLAHNIALAKKKLQKQQTQIAGDTENKRNTLTLQPKQEANIREIIADMTKQIDGQINEIKKIKSALNIS